MYVFEKYVVSYLVGDLVYSSRVAVLCLYLERSQIIKCITGPYSSSELIYDETT